MDEKKIKTPDQKFAESTYRNGPVKSHLAPGKKERKLITKLCNRFQNLCTVIPGDPEYNALECCISDDEAKVALKMKLRKQYTFKMLLELTKLPENKLRSMLDNMTTVGLVMIDPMDPEKHEPVYWVPIFVPGIMEILVGNKKLVEANPIIAHSFAEYTIKRIIPISGKLPVGKGVMRVIPIESALKDVPHDTHELISNYIDTATDICVSPCSCRVSRRLMDEGCGHLEDDMCIQLNEAARSFIHTGRARRIDKEEALAIIKKAEENGLMHEMPNTDGAGRTHAICNCCGCSCFSLRTAEFFHTGATIRSNYVSAVDPEKCVACGECVEVCPVNALKLGEKLKNKEDIKIKLPVDSSNQIWGADKWNPDYRFNREMVMKETGTAPCKVACPAHIAIEGYLELAKEGRYAEALELIKKKNPFPAVCGRVCNKRCEDACTRATIDSAVSIDEVKKFVAQLDMENKSRVIPEKMHDFSDHKMAVIGAGPAGLSCAYFLAVKGYSVTVFEKEKLLGGMLTLGIPSFRLEKDVINAEIDCLKALGVEFKTGVEVGKDVTIDELRKKGYGAFYVAIGAQGARQLGISGEDAEGVISGIEFLRNVNLKTMEKLSGDVVVIGGGNVAIDVARTAVRYGAKSVTLYCLESRETMPAAKDEVDEALEEKIIIKNGWGPKTIVTKDGKACGIVLKKCLSTIDENKHFNPVYDENVTEEVNADFILSSIGQSFIWGDLLKGSKAVLGKGGRLEADPLTYQTAEKDIFVGGDCYHGARFAIDAIATGQEAAESMHRFAHPGQSLYIGRVQNPYLAEYSLDKDNIEVSGWDNTPRASIEKAKVKDPMKDDRKTLSEEAVKKECARCLQCGRTFVDETICVGCGLCTTKCKFDAIHLEKRWDSTGVDYSKEMLSVAPHVVARGVKIIFSRKKPKYISKDELGKQSDKKLTIK